jgi:hypothetical protein
MSSIASILNLWKKNYSRRILNFICLYITFAAIRDGVPVWKVDPAIEYRLTYYFYTISINYWMHPANAKFLNNLHKATKIFSNNLVIRWDTTECTIGYEPHILTNVRFYWQRKQRQGTNNYGVNCTLNNTYKVQKKKQ